MFVLVATNLVNAVPVINEIHYNNDRNEIRNEFVELYNPADVDVDLGGWELDGAIRYTFPSGVVLPGGGFVVVAEDPAVITSEFGVTALGPYSGGLNSDGELLELVNASGGEVDRVDYRAGFPWPSWASGEGSSMELINASLDNDLGSSWRSSMSSSDGPSEAFIPASPTPGLVNSSAKLDSPPNIRQVSHFPNEPYLGR